MKRRFPGYRVETFWFGKPEPDAVRWEPSLARAHEHADWLVRHHRFRDDSRYWVHVSVTNLRTGRSVSCC